MSEIYVSLPELLESGYQRESERLVFDQANQSEQKARPSRRRNYAVRATRGAAALGLFAGFAALTARSGYNTLEHFIQPGNESSLYALSQFPKGVAKTALSASMTLAAPLIPLVYPRRRK